VVFIAGLSEGRPVKSRMGVFPDIFSMMDSGSKTQRAGVNHGLDGD